MNWPFCSGKCRLLRTFLVPVSVTYHAMLYLTNLTTDDYNDTWQRCFGFLYHRRRPSPIAYQVNCRATILFDSNTVDGV